MNILEKQPFNVTLAIFMVLTGCSTSVRHVTLDSNKPIVSSSILEGVECTYKIGQIVDGRRDKQSLGRLGFSLLEEGPYNDEPLTGIAISTAGIINPDQSQVRDDGSLNGDSTVIKWLRQGLEFAGLNNGQTDPQAITINIILKMAYINNAKSAKVSNIAFAANLNDSDQDIIVRGSDTAINWMSGSSEIHNSFNRSLANAIDNLVVLAKNECQQ